MGASELVLDAPPCDSPTPEEEQIFVYKMDGGVDELDSITTVVVTDRYLILLSDELTVATYDRADVYFASRCRISPPVLF